MRSKLMIVLLFILSFNILHDSVITLVDQPHKTTQTVIHEKGDLDDTVQYFALNDIHDMFHFIAIISGIGDKINQDQITEAFIHYLTPYTSPYFETSLKPPIA